MAQYILPPAPPGSGSDWQQTIQLPPPSEVVESCNCANLSVQWFNGTLFATSVEDQDVLPVFAVGGTICPGTTYNLSPAWTPDGGGVAPTISQFANGAAAWAVEATDTGILEVGIVANCNGQLISLDTLFLTVLSGYYQPALCVPPTEYTNLLALEASLCININYSGTGAGSYDHSSGTDWFVYPIPYYANIGGTVDGGAGARINFIGLKDLFGSNDAMVRVTITDGSLTAGAYPFFCDNKNDLDDFPLTAGTYWEYTIANADLDNWVTGMGTGDGSGDPHSGDYFQFRIEVKVA